MITLTGRNRDLKDILADVGLFTVGFLFLQKYLYNKYSLIYIYIYLYMLINIKHIYIYSIYLFTSITMTI